MSADLHENKTILNTQWRVSLFINLHEKNPTQVLEY